jgi:hypothetical protein
MILNERLEFRQSKLCETASVVIIDDFLIL